MPPIPSPFGMVPGASGPATAPRPLSAPFQRLDPMAARLANGQMVAGFGYTPPTPQVPGMPQAPTGPGYMGSNPLGPGGGMGGGMGPGGAPGGLGGLGGPSLGGMGYDGHPGIGPSQGIGGGGLTGPVGPTGPGTPSGTPSAPSMGGDWSAPDLGAVDSYSDIANKLGGILGGPAVGFGAGLLGTAVDAAAMSHLAPPDYSTNWGSVLMDATPVLGWFAGTSYANQVRKAIETAALSRTGKGKYGGVAGPTATKDARYAGLGALGGVKSAFSGPGYGGGFGEKSLARGPDFGKEGIAGSGGGGGASAKGGGDAGGGSKGKSADGKGGGKNGGSKGGY